MPIQLSGVGGPHGQKLILAHISNNSQSSGGGGTGMCPTSQHQQITIAQAQQGGGVQNVVPLIRPAQPGSPIIVRANPGGQNPQFLVSFWTFVYSFPAGCYLLSVGVSSYWVNRHYWVQGGIWIWDFFVNINECNKLINLHHHHSLLQCLSCIIIEQQNASSTTTVITPQQLAMLIQQQHQQAPSTSSSHHHNHLQQIRPASPSPSQQTHQQLPTFINVNQLNRPVAVSVSQPSRPNSASSVVLTNPNPYNSNPPVANSHKLLTSSTTIPQSHFLRQSFVPVSSQSSSSSPPVRHQLIHIQKQQFVTSSNNPSSPGGPSTGSSYPVRAQIVTSNGETITIHRASAENSNGPMVRVATPPRPLSYSYNNGQQTVVGQPQIQMQGSNSNKRFIAINRVGSPGVISSGQQQIQLVSSQRASPGPVAGVAKQGSGSGGVSLGISGNTHGIQKPGQGGGIRLISLDQGSNNNNLSSSGNVSDLGELIETSLGGTPLNSISNLAEFITNQLAASNIRSISPLTLDQNLVKVPNNGEVNSPQQQISSRTNSQAQQGGIMIISSMANNSTPSSSTTSSNAAVNSNVISSSSSIGGAKNNGSVSQALSDFFNSAATPTTTEIIMDFQDALGSDSPYSLISESDSHAIAEIIDLHPSHHEIVVTSSAPSGSYIISNTASLEAQSKRQTQRAWPVNQQGQNLIPVSLSQSLGQGNQQRQISSGVISLKPNPSSNPSFSQSLRRNAPGNATSYTLTSSSPSTLLTSSTNRNRITTSSSNSSSPFIFSSGGGHNTSVLQVRLTYL